MLATPAASYWEEHDTAQGHRFVAFVRYVLAPADPKRLVDAYGKPETALGATVVPAFPEVGWRWPGQTAGAIVIGLGAAGSRTSAWPRSTWCSRSAAATSPTPAAFARIATEEVTRLEQLGGTLQLEVQADDPRPKSFAQAIKAKQVEAVGDGGKDGGSGKHSGGKTGTGGVNVWDRYDQRQEAEPGRSEPVGERGRGRGTGNGKGNGNGNGNGADCSCPRAPSSPLTLSGAHRRCAESKGGASASRIITGWRRALSG